MRQVTPAQALRNAIAAEAAAAGFYEALALRSEDPQVRTFFENMIRVEMEHGDEIERMGKQFVTETLPAFADEDIATIETAPTWKDAEGLGFDEALHIAILCENQAAMHYADLADLFEGRLRSFFRDVAASEVQHGRMLENVLHRRIAAGTSTFTIEQVVRNLIEIERASARFYTSLAKRCPNAQARSFLQGMVEVEELHAGQIVTLGQALSSAELPGTANLEVKHLEAPPSWPAPIDIDLQAALQLALDAERRAGQYYATLARCFSGEHATFLEQMATTEQGHANSIEDLLTRLREEND